jgi:hypothetical protein
MSDGLPGDGLRPSIADAVDGADARDAERYRWLRQRDLDTIFMGGVFVGKTPENIVLNGIDLDAAVDAARVAELAPDVGDGS